MHGDRSGEFLRGYWSLKDKMIADNFASVGRRGRELLIAHKQRIKARRGQ